MKCLFASLVAVCLCIHVHAQPEGYATNGSTRIYYRTYGTGIPMLIINGGPGMNSDGFVTLAKTLSADAHTIIYDQRGTGRSVLPQLDSTTVTMELMVEDIECLRKQLQIDKWIILGHSFGGMLAAYYTTRYPQHVTSLILSSSGGIDLALLKNVGTRIRDRLNKTDSDSLRYWDSRINAGDTSYSVRLGRGRALAPAYLYDRRFIPTIAERLTQGVAEVTNLVWQDMQRIEFDCKPGLRTFTRPVLIIQGREDIIDKQIALTEQRTFPHSTLVFMDRCAHYGWLDRPDVYFPTIRQFINRSGL